ncbi:MAG TPA: LuxR family transcriptional regulator [Xanthobacteraceae bacterium]|nr:LuxR family transcriptional regulator [Xanthobacteraceae bacterium]
MTAASVNYRRAALDVIEEFDHLKTPEEVVERLASSLSIFGFSSVLITGMPEPPRHVEAYFLRNGWPRGWTQRFANENNYAEDPVASWGRRNINPFEWSKALVDGATRPSTVKVMRAVEASGSRTGFVVPVIRACGAVSCVTLAGERPEFEPRATSTVRMLSLCAHARAVELLGLHESAEARGTLTPREREVLHWIAGGKSSWDISVILGISERAVNWLIASATRKVNAVNRTQAVVNAIRTGEISI